MTKNFINSFLSKALNDFQISKSNPEGILYNSFYVVVIRLLVLIYDEEEILNPYFAMDEDTFNNCLKKYGYHIDDILKFEHALDNYSNKETSNGFVFIQQKIIDMFICKIKKVNVTNEEINEFRNVLYSSKSSNPLVLSYNFKMSVIPDEVLNYFEDELKLVNNKYSKPRVQLSMDAYEVLNYSEMDIKSLNQTELEKVNNKIYNYFNIDVNAEDRDFLLERVINELQNKKTVHSSGHINLIFIISLIIIFVIGLAFITIKIL